MGESGPVAGEGGRGASTRAAVSALGLRERRSPAPAPLGGVLAPRWCQAGAFPGCCKRTLGRRKGRTPPPPGRQPLPWGGSGSGAAAAGRPCQRGGEGCGKGTVTAASRLFLFFLTPVKAAPAVPLLRLFPRFLSSD